MRSFGILDLQSESASPTPRSGFQKKYMKCGHCVAICEHRAISHEAMAPEQCPPAKKEWLPGLKEVEHILWSPDVVIILFFPNMPSA